MTAPGRNGGSSTGPNMLPKGAPFDDSSLPAGSSYPSQHQSSSPIPPRTRTNWSLWPLKMASTSFTHRSDQSSSTTMTQQQQSPPPPPSSRLSKVYPISISSSPPSPFGHGNLSDSSPPSTPPDYASTSYITTPNAKLDRQHLSPQTTSSISASSPSSRNNIFSSPVVSPVPAPRLQVGEFENFATNRLQSRSTNKNTESPTSQPASSPQSPTSIRGLMNNYGRASIDAGRPSYGRANTEERAREMDRVRRNNAEVDFRLCPIKDYLLGEGRHCTVYLGSFRTKQTSNIEVVVDNNRYWTLCAIKRLHADRQSQLLGLEEAFALRRLGPHPHIVGLISIRDEVELSVTSHVEQSGETSWSGVAIPLSMNRDHQQEEMQYRHGPRGSPLSPGLVSHWRSSSESQAEDVVASEKTVISRRNQTHRRQVSTPTNAPIVMIASPEGDEVFGPPITPDLRSWEEVSTDESNKVDPPRLLMLLELLPYNLSSFAKKNPDRVNLIQWKRWAIELTGVVEWLHKKGCVHADLKPENVLLTSDLTVKLCDFNSALFPTPNTPLTDGLGLGTPAYGAPELASRSSKGFSYPIDIWSLGAILYTLAVGSEPFQKARSMIDILHRKGRFFESEENDRIASLCVAEGRSNSLNGGSTNASRNGSLRGKKKIEGHSDIGSTTSTTRPPTTAPMLQRELSNESISSIASSVMLSGSSGRNPSVRAVSMLLEPGSPVAVVVPSIKQFKFGRNTTSSNNLTPLMIPSHGHHRATSLGKGDSKALLSPVSGSNRRANPLSRPTVLRRTTSYEDSLDQDKNPSAVEKENPAEQDTFNTDPTGLRLAVTAAFAQSSRDEIQKGIDDEEFAQQQRPYADGSLALILPGGGRLPDEARNLLEKMLYTDANRRPTAAQVKQLLQTL